MPMHLQKAVLLSRLNVSNKRPGAFNKLKASEREKEALTASRHAIGVERKVRHNVSFVLKAKEMPEIMIEYKYI